jgi:hypothetical protein
MAINSRPFGGVTLTGEDARQFVREMEFTEATHKMLRRMATQVEPEIWVEKGDLGIVNRLRSLKRARDWFEALLAQPDADAVIATVRALQSE